jgi:hypothetical protein
MEIQKDIRILIGLFLGFVMLFIPVAAGAGDDRVVAKVGDDTITEKQLKEFAGGVGMMNANINEKDTLDQLVTRSIIYQDAKKKGIDKRQDIKNQLAANERNLVIQTYMKDELMLNDPVTEDMAKELWEKNWMDSRYPRWVSLILISVNFKNKDMQEKAEQYATNLRAKIDSEELTRDYESGLKKLKEELPPPEGITLRASLYKKVFLSNVRSVSVLIEEVAKKLKKGEMSEPLRSPQGLQYVLVNLLEEYPKEELSFEKIKSDLMLSGSKIKYKEAMDSYFEKHKHDYKIEYLSK